MSIKRMELCGACAATMKDGGFSVQQVTRSVDQKVVCANCGKRRYGGAFDVEAIRKSDTKE